MPYKPTGTLTTVYDIPSPQSKRVIATTDAAPPGKLDKILTSMVRLYIIGKVVYDDEFGTRHVAVFGSLYDPAMDRGKGEFQLVPDPGYNYGD